MASERNRESKRNRRDRALASLATSQRGVVSLEQLTQTLDVTDRAASHRADSGALHRVHRGVYAVGHQAYGRQGQLKAALLACGEGAVLSHGTAAALWRLRDRPPTLIDVTGGRQAGRKIDGIRCRRCRYPALEEIVAVDGLMATTPARTLVDLAGMLGERSLRRLVERAAVRKLLDLDALDRAMANAKGRRGVSTLRAALAPWRPVEGPLPDVRSEFEALVLPRLLEIGLPRPACNKTLQLGGERLMVDFLWEPQRVVVETDGRETHDTPVAFQRDRRRDQILVAAGYRVARATWDQIHGELDAVVARIQRALRTAS
ncbi:MAG TPA: DUF559 domain-containing protein [Solirubrobacterales bacterium]|nr:DUF559 domain-containing protein [Solirubrobacterales bacterium]